MNTAQPWNDLHQGAPRLGACAPQSPSLARASHAFTLLEILLTLAVIGAIAVGVTFSVTSVDAESRLRRAVDDLEVLLSNLTTQASITHTPCWVELRPGGTAVSTQMISVAAFDGGLPPPLDHKLPGGVAVDAVRMDGQVLSANLVRLVIQPSGYLRAFAVRLAYDNRRSWARWDPVDMRLRTDPPA